MNCPSTSANSGTMDRRHYGRRRSNVARSNTVPQGQSTNTVITSRRSAMFSFLNFCFMVTLFCCLLSSVLCSKGSSQCFMHGPGTTVVGADYRRDYGVSRRECAVACRDDGCCLAFVWTEDGKCTLKSRSLNSSVEMQADAYFGICLDYDDSDRDRLWDHEITGPLVFSRDSVGREACCALCGYHLPATVYSWRPADPLNMDGELGNCSCITAVHGIRLEFGSFAGFIRKARQ